MNSARSSTKMNRSHNTLLRKCRERILISFDAIGAKINGATDLNCAFFMLLKKKTCKKQNKGKRSAKRTMSYCS